MDQYHYPPPSRIEGAQIIYRCAVCLRYAARQIGPKRYQCDACKSTINYIPQKRKQEKPSNGSRTDK